jgi:alcohol dehydrogenase class IV
MTMLRFEFSSTGRILFGSGCLQEVGKTSRQYGTHAFIVTGTDAANTDALIALLESNGVRWSIFPIAGEPSIDLVIEGVRKIRIEGCDHVIGIGGGSAIDTGKAVSAMLTNPGDLLDYLEVIGSGNQLTVPAAPFIAIPTTAGTGAEVTKNAVLSSPKHRVKVSLRSPLILPSLAVVDPDLTVTCPQTTTAYSGMDALSQLIEPYVSIKANPLTDTLCREGIQRAAYSLRRAYQESKNREARQDMAIASLFGGLALANAGLGAVHGFSGVIGGMFPIPHGALCARLLPYAMEVNINALREREPHNQTLQRYEEIARIVTGDKNAHMEDGIHWVSELIADLRIPSLREFGIKRQDFPVLADLSLRSSSMKGNIIQLTDAELIEILEKAL